MVGNQKTTIHSVQMGTNVLNWSKELNLYKNKPPLNLDYAHILTIILYY